MILFKKEKEVIELIEKHADKVAECMSNALSTIQAYLDGDIQNAKRLARQTDNLETQADLIRHQVRDKLYMGAYMPLLREDVYKLVESFDMVANAAEKCCDTFLNQRPIIPDSLKSEFHEIVKISTSIIDPLKHTLLCYLKGLCPVEVSRQYAKDVGLIESKVDSLDWDITKKIFSSELRHSHKLHLKICIKNIVDLTDKAEYAADHLELVVLKAMI